MNPQPMEGCATEAQLRSALDSESRLAALLPHLEACPACLALMAQMQATDPLSQALESVRTRWSGRSLARTPDMPVGYQMLGEVARGGQGVVFKAVQSGTQRPVAIKMLLLGAYSSSEQRKRLHQEARLVGRLNHPHVVHVHCSGETAEGTPYLVLEWIEGQDLAAMVRSEEQAGQPKSLDQVLQLFDKVAGAVEAAHAAQVLHRDLKPSNVLVDSRGEPHVVDFGLAKLSGPARESATELTQTGTFLGSLAWSSPEQVEPSGVVDERTDIHGLGLVLYFLLTGVSAHGPADSIAALLLRITTKPPGPPSRHSRVGPIPSAVDALVMRALAKDKSLRFGSVAELRQALAAANRPDLKRPWTLGKRCSLGALALACLLAGWLIFDWASAPANSDSRLPAQEQANFPGPALGPQVQAQAWALRAEFAQTNWISALPVPGIKDDTQAACLATNHAKDLVAVATSSDSVAHSPAVSERIADWGITLYRPSQGSVLRQIDLPQTDVTYLQIDREGNWLAVGRDGAVSVYSIADPQATPRIFEAEAGGKAIISSYGSLIVLGKDGVLTEYDLDTQRLLHRYPGERGLSGSPAAAFLGCSPDHRFVVLVQTNNSPDSGIATLDLSTGKVVHTLLQLRGSVPVFFDSSGFALKYDSLRIAENGGIRPIAGSLSQLGSYALFSGPAGLLLGHQRLMPEVVLLDPLTRRPRSTAICPAGRVLTAAVCPQTGYLSVLGEDGRLCLWNPTGDHWKSYWPLGHTKQDNVVSGLHRIVKGSETGEYFTADGRQGTITRVKSGATQSYDICASLPSGVVNAVVVSGDGRQLAVSSTLGVHLGDTADPQNLGLVYSFPDESLCNDVAFSRDGSLLGACSGGGMVVLIDIQSRKLFKQMELSPMRIGSLTFGSIDGVVYCGCQDGQVYTFDWKRDQVTKNRAPGIGNLGAVASSGTGLLAAGSLYGHLTLWREGQAEPYFHGQASTGFLYALRFYGPYLITCDELGCMQVREAQTGALLAQFEQVAPLCLDLLIEPENNRIACVGSGDSIVWLDFDALDRCLRANRPTQKK